MVSATLNNEDWKNSLWHQDSQNYWYILKIRNLLWSCLTEQLWQCPTFLIKLWLPRVQESPAAKLECCEIHEKIWVFLKTFLIVNMLYEIMMHYTIIQEIWRHHRRFWELKELRKLRAKNHCNQDLYLAFRWEQDKSLDGGKCPVSETSHVVGIGTCTQGMTISSYLSSEMHLQKFHDQTKFQSWIVNFRTEIFEKAKNLALVLLWVKKIKVVRSLKDLINPKSTTGENVSDYEELDLWWRSDASISIRTSKKG